MSKRLPYRNPRRVQALHDALARRILVIDGAMGTMVQSYRLEEDDYRGERFADLGVYFRARKNDIAGFLHCALARVDEHDTSFQRRVIQLTPVGPTCADCIHVAARL